ncbi:MAG TPA: NAD(P)-dependent oxidoreductase [Chloroflexota bacterium]|nr:NAD(P)-dependent oxidoreductase [Chloroflexota bacterium]
MTVLITGGGGFLGVRLAKRLIEAGHAVVLLDRAFPEAYAQLAPTGAERRTGDVTDRAELWRTIEAVRPSGVVHLAAVLSAVSETDPALAFDVNVLGTFNVLEGARRVGVGEVVATSSIAAIERPEPSPPVDEAAPTSPLGVYGMSKAALEAWCLFYRRRWGMDVRVARPGAVVGPGRAASSAASNFTTAMILEPLEGRPYRCPVAEDDAAPIVYHTDLIDGLAKLYLAPKAAPIYNLGACSASAGQLAAAVRHRLPGARITFEPLPARPRPEAATRHPVPGTRVDRFVVGRWKHVVQDNRLAERDLGYRPRYTTAQELVDAFITESRGSAASERRGRPSADAVDHSV